ncbi:putative Ig domain-containing protein [Macromonas bipunctata]|uniref:RCC1 domain-containing protein n=1 Tax=Macromonas bipunctata TaxID=183670 RepID=UPI001F0C3335|nr:putative Ig domain-containing protein [Macromonas bipunctata]
MFSLIITIISIALTVAVTGGTMYYIGSATDEGGDVAAAAQLLTQSEQIAAAIDMRGLQAPGLLASVPDLVTGNYLAQVPVPPERAYASGTPKASDWWVVKEANRPVVVLQAKIKEKVCLAFNEKFQGNSTIRETIDPTLRIQCYGTAAPYSVLINTSTDSKLAVDSVDSWNDAVTAGTTPPGSTPLPQPQAAGGAVASSGTVSLATATLPAWKVGQFVNYDFKALFSDSQDAAPLMSEVVWSAEGTLPAGLVLDSATGVLSGTPATKGTLDYTVKATYKNATGQQVYKIVVQGIELEVVSISGGGGHTCAVTTSGGAKCWGDNWAGQLGNNSTDESGVPVDVADLTSGVASIASGDSHTCAVTTSGGAKCWGWNLLGQLGNDSTTNSLAPVDVSGLTSGVASIDSGLYHTCAVTTSGGAKCWGDNQFGKLGNDSTTPSWVPVDVWGLTSGVASIASGGSHTCAVTTSGGAKCWGQNYYGQLGNNSTDESLVPVDVSGLTSGVASIASGADHTCAVTTSGGAKCWGRNFDGQLGNDSTTNSLAPVDVSGLTSGVASIASGDVHACAVTTSGGAKCWGRNYSGQLGNNSFAGSSVPVDVSGLTSGVVSISLGYYHTCAVTTSGGAKCWGGNGNGQLGNTSNTDSEVPGDVLNP